MGSSVCAPTGARAPGWPAGHDELPGECGGRGGKGAPGSIRLGSAYRLGGDCPACTRGSPRWERVKRVAFPARSGGPAASGASVGAQPGWCPKSWTRLASWLDHREAGNTEDPRDCAPRGWLEGALARTQGLLAGRKVPGSGKVAGWRPALPLPAAAFWVTLGLRTLTSVSSVRRRGPRSLRR